MYNSLNTGFFHKPTLLVFLRMREMVSAELSE